MDRLNAFDWVMAALLWLGAILWGLIGFFQYDLLAELFGASAATARTIQAAVGLAAVAELVVLMVKAARPHPFTAGHQPARV